MLGTVNPRPSAVRRRRGRGAYPMLESGFPKIVAITSDGDNKYRVPVTRATIEPKGSLNVQVSNQLELDTIIKFVASTNRIYKNTVLSYTMIGGVSVDGWYTVNYIHSPHEVVDPLTELDVLMTYDGSGDIPEIDSGNSYLAGYVWRNEIPALTPDDALGQGVSFVLPDMTGMTLTLILTLTDEGQTIRDFIDIDNAEYTDRRFSSLALNITDGVIDFINTSAKDSGTLTTTGLTINPVVYPESGSIITVRRASDGNLTLLWGDGLTNYSATTVGGDPVAVSLNDQPAALLIGFANTDIQSELPDFFVTHLDDTIPLSQP